MKEYLILNNLSHLYCVDDGFKRRSGIHISNSTKVTALPNYLYCNILLLDKNTPILPLITYTVIH